MRKVFLDCGAHKGESIDLFRKVYPNADEYEIYSFEAHPEFADEIKKRKNINFYNVAVWIKDSTITFYLGNNLGSTVEAEKRSDRRKDNKTVEVKSIDFSKFIKKNFKKSDHIILKMDIECAEYQVIPKMIKDKTLDYINVLYIEFHGDKCTGRDLKKRAKLSEMTKKLKTMFDERENLTVYVGGHVWNPPQGKIKGVTG